MMRNMVTNGIKDGSQKVDNNRQIRVNEQVLHKDDQQFLPRLAQKHQEAIFTIPELSPCKILAKSSWPACLNNRSTKAIDRLRSQVVRFWFNS